MVWNDCSADAVPQRCEPVCVCDVRAVALWRRIFKRSVLCAVFGAVSRKPVFIVDLGKISQMAEWEDINPYKTTNIAEKLFRSDKYYRGKKSMRVYVDEA